MCVSQYFEYNIKLLEAKCTGFGNDWDCKDVENATRLNFPIKYGTGITMRC